MKGRDVGNIKGYKFSEETKENISPNRLGIKHSEETKEKMRLTKLGSNNAMFGKKQSEETTQKRSQAMKRYWIERKINGS